MPENDLRLLALDGGGVRDLLTLQILKQLMDTINPKSSPKPCDYFDMIGGTSTGGMKRRLIAIMLGRLYMTVDECIDAYISLSDRVFQKQRHRMTIKGQVQGRFDSDELERAIKEIVVRQGEREDALLKDAQDAKGKIRLCNKQRDGRYAGRAMSAASFFFDSITIGDFGESFVDGATGANNPVYEVWNEAQDIWPSGLLEDKVKCLVSIGTGVPSLTLFKDDLLSIGRSLLAIAIETEKTAERFSRDKSRLDNRGQYYRFNVLRGLEDIGLEDSKGKNTIIAATDRYIESHAVFKQIKACADNVGSYQTQFSLRGVPVVNKFIDRPSDMEYLEQALFRQGRNDRQKVLVVHGLGGIGKTQLAVEFTRQHHRKFSSVFWLDGRTEDSLKRSIETCASRIPEGQIAESSRAYSTTSTGDINVVITDMMGWLSHPDKRDWLIVFDNVGRERGVDNDDPDAYDVPRYIPGGDYGSVLITTRLISLEQLDTRANLFEADPVKTEELFRLLDGLPLAIAQASAYLRESGISFGKYIQFHNQQWKSLMESQDRLGIPLRDYPERSVWTTWMISYKVIQAKSMATANLLLLWACLDNKDMWYGLLARASIQFIDVADRLSKLLDNIAMDGIEFNTAMRLLRSYSLIEALQDVEGYTTHSAVHRWALHIQDKQQQIAFSQLAILTVGWAVPMTSEKESATIQRRLLEHAQQCYPWAMKSEIELNDTILDAIVLLGILNYDQSKLNKAEKMYQRALEGKEKALGRDHISTLNTVNNIGNLYRSQGKLDEAEKIYQRALEGNGKTLGQDHTSTLNTVHNLGNLYVDQDKLNKSEKTYQRVLEGYEKALGRDHISILNTVNNLGNLYRSQGKLDEAEKIYQ
ncbi:FabD/lysophospholipase-like protein [Delitschia confertaspora ATCC 74209]|uniref:FabD/lysophospholipase-like protein n=1 Tax=Delitschia confertaspora ATCC 74209 TaxID=1513339 RepID=A0A9P4JRE6_9PLEO|nr:FabD/lysophospholipase-like protein [Delitschia confertaspora ATCC 74209]